MEALIRHHGKVAVLDRLNVDTDQIIPKQFLKRIERSGFGQFLFHDWRFGADGQPNADFEWSDGRANGASVLVAGDNFGCGSSREHAAWALTDYGFRVVIAPSFADIFYNNSFKSGLLPVVLDKEAVATLMSRVERTASEAGNAYHLTVDLEQQTVSDDGGFSVHFEVDPFRRKCLLEGLDDIGLTLAFAEKIIEYEDANNRESLERYELFPNCFLNFGG